MLRRYSDEKTCHQCGLTIERSTEGGTLVIDGHLAVPFTLRVLVRGITTAQDTSKVTLALNVSYRSIIHHRYTAKRTF